MRTLKFSGHSDDVFQYYDSDGGGDEAYGSPAVFKLTHKDYSVLVVGYYNPRDACGCWSVGLCQTDEDLPIPPWSPRFDAEGYSTVLYLNVPDSVKVEAL